MCFISFDSFPACGGDKISSLWSLMLRLGRFLDLLDESKDERLPKGLLSCRSHKKSKSCSGEQSVLLHLSLQQTRSVLEQEGRINKHEWWASLAKIKQTRGRQSKKHDVKMLFLGKKRKSYKSLTKIRLFILYELLFIKSGRKKIYLKKILNILSRLSCIFKRCLRRRAALPRKSKRTNSTREDNLPFAHRSLQLQKSRLLVIVVAVEFLFSAVKKITIYLYFCQ